MRTFNITVNGQTYVVDVEEVGGVQTAAPVRAAAPVAAAPVAAAPAAAETARAAVTAAIIKKSERGELSQNRQIRGTGFVNCAI